MELKEIITYIESPDKVLDIRTMEEVIDWATHWIYTLELELADDDFILDGVLNDLITKTGKVNQAEAALRLTEEYRARKKKELTLKALKAYRANIRKKRDRMTNSFHL